MGRAIGIVGAFMAGVRVAGQLTYIPAYRKLDGSTRSQRCIIPVYRNSNRGTNQKTGEKGRVDSFKLVAWGKLADVCARSLPKGTAIDVICEPQSFLGTLFNQDGSPRMDNAGQVIQTTKVSFVVNSIVFGEDSDKQIDREIAEGRRPQYWNVKGHPDFQTWKTVLQTKQQVTWDGTNVFGHARVVAPKDGQIDMSVYQGGGAPVAAPGAPVNPTNGLPAMVAQVAGGFGAPLTQPVNPNVVAPVATPGAQLVPAGQPAQMTVAVPGAGPAASVAPAGQPLY